MTDSFYRAFEERYRGPRELIKSRLRVYLPFLLPLLDVYPFGSAIDLGCGRGEWLELLNEYGFNACGIDQDDSMLQVCRAIGLNVQTDDALMYLRKLPPASQIVVTGFHIAEHLSFDQLQEIVIEAKRVLKPGGLLILETPNPENISVATYKFYLDPTHLRPIPPDLLAFLPEHCGYARVKLVRLQEPFNIDSNDQLSLMHIILGVSLDYAVVAQTDALPLPLDALDKAFSSEYGVTMQQLTGRYQQQLYNLIMSSEVKAQQAEVKAQQAEVQAQQAEVKAQQAEVKAQQVEIHLRSYTAEFESLNNLSSHIAIGLCQIRVAARTLKRISSRLRPWAPAKKINDLLKKQHFVSQRLWQSLIILSHKLRIYKCFKSLYRVSAGYSGRLAMDIHNNIAQDELISITPRTRQIYLQLKEALKHQCRELN